MAPGDRDQTSGDTGGDAPEPGGEAAPIIYRDDLVLTFGGNGLASLPEVPELSFTRNPDEPAGLTLLLPGAVLERPFDALVRRGRLPAPIADFGGDAGARADFKARHLTARTLREAVSETQPIRDALNTLPAIPANDDRNGLMALSIAITRDAPIEAGWVPGSKDLVGYPALAGIPDVRGVLEAMAAAKLLTRRFFERLNQCGHCGSARLPVRETCPECNSSNVADQSLVNHYRCGYQAQKSAFEQGQGLICPKCTRELRHYGVDYDTPGQVTVCASCGHVADEPAIAFVCADCGETTRGNDVRSRDWFHYDLTTAAQAAVEEGRLPGVGIESILNQLPGWRTPRDLAMMVDVAHRVKNRYKRPYSVLMVNYTLSPEEQQRLGRTGAGRVQQMIVDLVRETVRETDFVAVLGDQLVLFLPETPHENSRVLLDRLDKRVHEIVGKGTDLGGRLVEDDDIPSLLDDMSKA